ncbi:hypothetical protein LINGRAHAP2_LOCUS5882, partial [Linum grandiflorum]
TVFAKSETDSGGGNVVSLFNLLRSETTTTTSVLILQTTFICLGSNFDTWNINFSLGAFQQTPGVPSVLPKCWLSSWIWNQGQKNAQNS